MAFVSSKSSPDQQLSRRDVVILAGVVLFSLLVFIVFSALTYKVGFPLDDAWIHQTYARNLALHGEWSFWPGRISAGSTSPLWTVLLSIGFFFKLSPYIWTYLLGYTLLLLICLLVEQTLRLVAPRYTPRVPWVGCLFALEWHLVWAAFSGMETVLHILFVLIVLKLLLTGSRNYLAAGIIIGLSIWIRPDGLTLLGPFALIILLNESSLTARTNGLLKLIFGFGGFFFLYLLFNLAISGSPFPNTFYAKQAEYAAWQSTPFGQRLVFFSLQFFQGLSIVLIPGFLQKTFQAFRTRNWKILLAVIWMLGYIVLYLMRLPVYQHGRYFMPALSVFLLIGSWGFFEGIASFQARHMRSLRTISLVTLLLILTVSFVFGAYTYSQDVVFIESQMVNTARWVAKNIPLTDKIAAHDIGALGYFGQHDIVDLAGLISPDIIPIINDDALLQTYLSEHKIKVLVAFSGWRPALTSQGVQLFIADSDPAARNGLGSMAVYLLNSP